MSSKADVCVLLLVAIGMFATTAQAHPKLLASNPAPGASLRVAPKSIRMSFSEGLVVRFTGLELKTTGGKVIATGKAILDGNNKTIAVPVEAPITPGTYNVSWHAVSTDTHRISGHYSFKVAR